MQGIKSYSGTKHFFEVISSIDWIILLILGPIYLFISPNQSWALLIIPLLWIISLLAGKKPISPTPFNLLFLIIVIQVLISLYATYDIAISLQKITGVVWGIAVFFALFRMNNSKKGILWSLIVFFVGGFGIATLGFLGIEWPSNKIILFNNFYSQFPSLTNLLPGIQEGFHPNEVGGALTWIIPFWIVILMWLIIRLDKLRRYISTWILLVIFTLTGLLVALSSVVLIFSQSRSAYIGMALGILLIPLFLLRKKLKIAYIVLLLSGLGIILYFVLSGQMMVYLNQLFPDSGTASMAFSMNTLSGRIEIWSRAIYAIQDFAFTGMGMNTFRSIVNVLYPLQTISADIPIKDIGHAHNLFLQVALDLGIPGLIAFIGMYITSFWMIFKSSSRLRRWTKNKPINHRSITMEFYLIVLVGLAGGQIAHLGYSMTDAIAFGAKPGIIFWVMQSIICGIFLITSKKVNQPSH